MKNLLIITLIIACFVAGNAADNNIKFKVWGNCEMCKKRIEGSLKGKSGIKSASWNEDSKMMQVNYDDSKLKEDDIHNSIAKAGYDTEKVKADEKAYNKLPECCQYERKK
ncbi:MAG: heavy-metal-associated domain-containing protein [Cytophagales bacterium]|nr:heavy-metal-associated domain-containing protein [Cytophagales bacterium]